MKIKDVSKILFIVSVLTVFTFFVSSAVSAADMARYNVTIQNLTAGQPLSPPVAASHKNKIGMFSVGELASPGLEAIAEDGNQSLMFNRFDNLANAGRDATDAVDVGAPVMIGGARSFVITANKGDRFSLATMLICTNDGFTGLDRAMPPKNGNRVYFLDAYDANTEMNTEMSMDIVDPCSAIGPVLLPGDPNGNEDDAVDMMPHMPIAHHPNISGVGDLTIADHGWMNPVAKVTITRTADDATRFLARLRGGGHVVPVETDATGRGEFRLNHGETMLQYELLVFDIEDVTMAHIHMGMPDMNGPVVAALFSNGITGEFDGLLARGTITESDLVGPLTGDFAAFVNALRNGELYVNVHTTANPPGEIRGQIGVRE